MSKHLTTGFSLIELMVVLTIIAIMSVMIMPTLAKQVQRHKESELKAALIEIRGALDTYKKAAIDGHVASTPNGYPKTLDELVSGVQDIKVPTEKKIYFLRRIPRDPFFIGAATIENKDTWGIRSYDTPPDNPSYTVDVFDIYSLSPNVGLNEIPYAKW